MTKFQGDTNVLLKLADHKYHDLKNVPACYQIDLSDNSVLQLLNFTLMTSHFLYDTMLPLYCSSVIAQTDTVFCPEQLILYHLFCRKRKGSFTVKKFKQDT